MTLQLRYVTHSETGPVRKNNQDSGYASPHLMVVADGMGGAAAGDLASAVAVDTLKEIDPFHHAQQSTAGTGMLDALASAVHRANDRLADLVELEVSLDGMGTTVTAMLFDGAELGLAHLGDSRAYLLRGGRLERLTHDHSWVQSLVDEGKISVDEAAVHPHRSLLLKVLNGHMSNDPDLSIIPVQAGDRLMLCSDGVCGLVDDPEIEAALRVPDPEQALRRLVDAALAEGGIDNITLIVADVLPGDTALAEDEVTLGAASVRMVPDEERERREPTVDLGGVRSAIAGNGTTGTAVEDTVATDRAGATAAVAAVPDDDPDGAGRPAPAPARTEEDEARYNPVAPRQRRLVRPLVGILVLALVVSAGLVSAYAWTRTQYYVGARDERVAIYRGLSDGLPGIPLSTLYEETPLTLAELPSFYASRVRDTIEASGLDGARATVRELTETARRCARTRPPSASPSPPGPTSTPSGSGTPRPTASLSTPGVGPDPNC